ncbi:hypothetical protein AB0K68_24650 [Streptomyces sp. NPDC050698]
MSLTSWPCSVPRHGHQAVVVTVAGGVLVLLGGLAPDSERAAAQVTCLGESLAAQLSGMVRVGVGEVVDHLRRAAESRRMADLALRALLSRDGPGTVARAGEVAETVAMLDIADTLREVPLPPEPPVTRLAAYDTGHGGALVDILRAYLDHFSDAPTASRELGGHPSTLR